MSDVSGVRCDGCGAVHVEENSHNSMPDDWRHEPGIGDLCAECRTLYEAAMSKARIEFRKSRSVK